MSALTRGLPAPLRRAVAPAIAITGVVAVWQLAAVGGLTPVTVPAPSRIWAELVEAPGRLWQHTWPTTVAALQGYVVAVTIAALIGAFTAFVPRAISAVYRAAVITHSIPLIALAPVLVVWLGMGGATRIAIAAIAGFFPILVACVQGFRAVDSGAEELLTVLAASRTQRLRYVVLPSAAPYIFAGLKIAAASAFLGAIIAEWSGADEGLGIAMIYALSAFNPPRVWLMLLVATGLSLALYVAVGLLERAVVRWDADRDAAGAGI